jgi:hypothetical protein
MGSSLDVWTPRDSYSLTLAIVEIGDTPATRSVLKKLKAKTLTSEEASIFIAHVEESRSRQRQRQRRRRRKTR